MGRLLTRFFVATAAMLVPVLALAGNQDKQLADKIAAHLHDSGRLSHYTIAVQCADGTAVLRGQVSDPEQLRTAMKLAFETEGVTGVVNNLTVVATPAPATAKPAPAVASQATETPAQSTFSRLLNPLRRFPTDGSGTVAQSSAQRVPASFTPGAVQKAAATEAVPDQAPQQMPQQRTYQASPLSGVSNGGQRPLPVAMLQAAPPEAVPAPSASGVAGPPMPMVAPGVGGAQAPTRFDQPNLPNYAWPSYAAYPNYAAVTYPKQYSATAWPYIGPFYPYPQVPLGWRKVTLQWDDGWWMLDFKDEPGCCWWR